MEVISVRPLTQLLRRSPEWEDACTGLAQRQEHWVLGLSGSQKSFFAASLLDGLKDMGAADSCLYVVTDAGEAVRIRDDLQSLLPHLPVRYLPPPELLPYEVAASSHDVAMQRLTVWSALARGEPQVVVAAADALTPPITPWNVWSAHCLELSPGMILEREGLLRTLVGGGYKRVEAVERRGQTAVRGGIVDLYPTEGPPLRLEFFGDEIETLRSFDVHSQLSTASLERAFVAPARELLAGSTERGRAIAAAERDLRSSAESLARKGKAEESKRLSQDVRRQLEELSGGIYFPGFHRYYEYLYPDPIPATDYFPSRTLVVFDEPSRIADTVRTGQESFRARRQALVENGELLPGQLTGWFDLAALAARLKDHPRLCFALLPGSPPGFHPQSVQSAQARVAPSFAGHPRLFLEEVRRWNHRRQRVVLMAGTRERAAVLSRSVEDAGLPVSRRILETPDWDLVPGMILVVEGAFSNGFEWPGVGLVLLTPAEIYGREKTKRPMVPLAENGVRVASYHELVKGDFVVHVHHGIGKYMGVVSLTAGGGQRDYLLIRYAGKDRLYVPVEQAGLVQKYVGGEGKEPKLNSLGGADWNRAKHRVRESVREMARELLKLEARRDASRGHAFSPDTEWQREFESLFPFEETPDQLQAASEVKTDMEKSSPMDRLLCGDVGFGKTEVAMRAAFKAVQDGKQVVILVPTTILAQQHYRTFRERLEDFPVTVEVLSRFRSPAANRETVRRLAAGEVDVIIGTHRLLQKDVRFQDLGLIIIDEEHRFGVAHKERMKKLRETVDILTLTATPIPRTLHMALLGIRGLSTIATPPENRFPVQTYVVEYSDALVRDAILKEIDRGGQVYLVHNRVQSIDRAAEDLRALLPEARIAVAHGQMPEHRLERIMLEFLEGLHDVLVSTSIIESGLDIPNVNTLVVGDADRFGLAQLYQLRGRVGRSDRIAYSYFLYRRDRILSETAQKRLQAIRDLVELGSGFQIAMRDLEIRGAGNLLGPEQHGYIRTVGFDLYCELLASSVREFRGEPPHPEKTPPSINLPVEAYLPDNFLPDSRSKVEIYRKLAGAKEHQAITEVAAELADRCGPAPPPVKNLLTVSHLRLRLESIGAESLSWERGRVLIKFDDRAGIQKLVAGFPRAGRDGVKCGGVKRDGDKRDGIKRDGVFKLESVRGGEVVLDARGISGTSLLENLEQKLKQVAGTDPLYI
ncbi:MAG: transcription-repair coupling factor [Firmicutes bacterium]|nr:transcription-repair coupling factor [Bacillota bacterium]